MSKKQEIPFTLTLPIEYDPTITEGLLLWQYNQVIKDGYPLSEREFYLLCAILIRREGIEQFPEKFKQKAFDNNQPNEFIRFNIIALTIELGEDISDEDNKFYYNKLLNRALERKSIVRKEVIKTGFQMSKFNLKNNDTSYYRRLLELIKGFDEITLLHCDVPIRLTFERLIHIYVRHLEETRFGVGNKGKRTFFQYQYSLIFGLLKRVITHIEEEIREHFLLVRVGLIEGDLSAVVDFNRGLRGVDPIEFADDKFGLQIRKDGTIMTFFQIIDD